VNLVSRRLLACALALCIPPAAALTRSDGLSDIDFVQHLARQVPAAARFVDDDGRELQLGELFGQRPVLLLPAYYHCPNLCGTALTGAFVALVNSGYRAGGGPQNLELVVVGIDPRELPAAARASQDRYLQQFPRLGDPDHIHFLTGAEPAIQAVTGAIGFHYRYDPELDQYVHPAGLVLLTPEGRASRYLFGVRHEARDLRLAILEASDHRIGSVVDRLLLLCCQYDPAGGRYNVVVLNVVRIAGGMTVVMLGGFLWLLRRGEDRR
jgi:protein SCO1/2